MKIEVNTSDDVLVLVISKTEARDALQSRPYWVLSYKFPTLFEKMMTAIERFGDDDIPDDEVASEC